MIRTRPVAIIKYYHTTINSCGLRYSIEEALVPNLEDNVALVDGGNILVR